MVEILGRKCITEKEAASLIGYSVAWLKCLRLAKKGPPFIRLIDKGKVFYDKFHLEKWIKEKIESMQ
jgi:hypothetical protein